MSANKNETEMYQTSFDVFISYRRSDGSTAARKLRQVLQNYTLPAALRRNYRKKLNVYLDTSYEIATSDFFQDTIRPALMKSRFLAILLTPDVATREDNVSDWVRTEVAEFESGDNAGNVFALYVKGKGNPRLPKYLLDRYPNIEIVDLRRFNSLFYFNIFRFTRYSDEISKVIAKIYGLSPNEVPVLRREVERRRGKIVLLAIFIMVLLTSAFAMLSIEIIRAKEKTGISIVSERGMLSARLLESDTDQALAIGTLLDIHDSKFSRKYDRVLSFWLPSFQSITDVFDRLPARVVGTIANTTIIKSNATIKKFGNEGIKKVYNDSKNSLLSIIDENNNLRIYDWNSLKLLQNVYLSVRSKDFANIGKVKSSDDEPIDGKLIDVSLFSKGDRFSVGVGINEATSLADQTPYLFVIDHSAKLSYIFEPTRIVLNQNTPNCSGTQLTADDLAENISFDNDRGITIVSNDTGASQTICLGKELKNDASGSNLDSNLLLKEIERFSFKYLRNDKVFDLRRSGEYDALGKSDINNLHKSRLYEIPFPYLNPELSAWKFYKLKPEQNGLDAEKDAPDEEGVEIENDVKSGVPSTFVLDGTPNLIRFHKGDKYYDFWEKIFALDGDDEFGYYAPELGGAFNEIDLGSDKLIVSNHGEGRWVASDICRFSNKGAPKFCKTFSAAAGADVWISINARLAIISGDKLYGTKTMRILNLNNFEENIDINPPPNMVVNASISGDSSRVSVVTCDGDLWIYRIGIPNPVQILHLNSTAKISSCSVPFFKGNPLQVDKDGGISLINMSSGNPLWISKPLPSTVEQIVSYEERNILLVRSSDGWVRFLDGDTGIPLSRTIKISEICSAISVKSTRDDIVRTKAGIPGFVCGDRIAVRSMPNDNHQTYDAKLLKEDFLFIPGQTEPDWMKKIDPLDKPAVSRSTEKNSGLVDLTPFTLKNKTIGSNESDYRPSLDPAPDCPIEASSNPSDKDASRIFSWPAKGRVIVNYGVSGNEGINIAVPEGTPVKAAQGGTVAYVGSDLKGYGKLILLRHEGNYVSAYAHNDDVAVNFGEKVNLGQIIAKSGSTGNVTSPQIHFEIRKDTKPVNPLCLLK